MPKYMLTIYQPDGPRPDPEFLEPILKDVRAVRSQMQDAGVWVFSGGLHDPSTATVLRLKDGEVLTTDGPSTEGHEHIGGSATIEAADLDAALTWGAKLARAVAVPIEVRPPIHE